MSAAVAIFGLQDASTRLTELRPLTQQLGDTSKSKDLAWSYDLKAADGPLKWPLLFNSKTGKGFCNAAMQSPIDIKTSESVKGAKSSLLLKWQNKTDFTITNNGKFIQITGDALGGDTTWFKDREYNLTRVLMHAPSEHRINGVQFPLELQFMHARKEGNTTEYMSFAVMYQMGSSAALESSAKYTVESQIVQNPALAQELLWSSLPKKAGETKKVKSSNGPEGWLSMDTLMPAKKDYYQYTGSLTYPPCTPGFEWLIFTDHRFLTYEQAAVYPLKGDFRPPQPLDARRVKWLTGAAKTAPAPKSSQKAFSMDCGLYGDNCGGDEFYVGSRPDTPGGDEFKSNIVNQG